MKMPKGFEIVAKETPAAGGTLPKWWLSLSDEAKEEYVAEHPNSKYAELHTKSKAEPKAEAPHKSHEGGETVKTEHHEPEVKHAVDHAKPINKEDLKVGSPIRKKAVAIIKSKAGSIVSHVKGEAKEWKAAGSALNDLRKGKKLDTHAKKAIASVATDVAILTTAIVSGGGAAHGVVAFLKHFGAHFLQDVMIKSAVKGVIHHHSEGEDHSKHHAALKAAADPMEVAVKKAMAELLKMIHSGDMEAYMRKNAHKLPPEIQKQLGLDKVHTSASTTQVDPGVAVSSSTVKIEADLDMSAATFNKGVCPDCKGPMIRAFVDKTPVWACPNDRIALPLENT